MKREVRAGLREHIEDVKEEGKFAGGMWSVEGVWLQVVVCSVGAVDEGVRGEIALVVEV